MKSHSPANPWRPRPWCAAWLLALGATAGSANAGSTLAQALDAAWQRSLEAAEAQGRERRVQAEQQLASSWLAAPPSASLSQLEGRGGASSQRETEIGLALPIWRPGQREANGLAAQAERDLARAAEQAARLRLAGQLREQAAKLKLLESDAHQAQLQRELLDRLAADVQRRVAAGDLAPADGLAARAEALAAAGAQREAELQLATQRSHWQLLTGQLQAPDPEDAERPAAAPHPEQALAEAAVARAGQRLAQVRSQRMAAPELGVGLRQERPGGGQAGQHSVQLSLRIPFGSEAHSQPQQAAALAEQDLALAQRERLRLQLQADQLLAREALRTAQGQAALEAERAGLLRQRAQWLDQSFKAGETALPELLRALAAAAQAEAAATRQQAALGLARARLLQSLGVLP
ncbi:TolC family protein [Pelomonas sp. SE-A7]|uniref:TolC family protein n=1 Tax=Pelomonas sp. SE-A7 TaxID=3054953 RepID=UPI00259C8820|nr:TolC family protein [Pelomonas sp. SE-A7]MDM4765403.1 TolC family protein [Pelomonas sp. SE-A7]